MLGGDYHVLPGPAGDFRQRGDQTANHAANALRVVPMAGTHHAPLVPNTPGPARSILGECQLLRRLSDESLDLLAGMARVKQFKKGERIFTQGDECPGFYCVSEGLVRVYKLAPTGKDHVLHFAEPGGTFGEVAAIIGMPAPAHADAVKETVCAILPASRLQSTLNENHQLSLQLLTGMAAWVKQLVGLLEDVVLRDASGRLARHLLEASAATPHDFFQLRVRKRDLASHLNLTSETLSRTLRRLTDIGLIETGEGQRIRVVDREQLDEVARGLLPAEFA
jgi:CRP-like cAMP-binding protein